MSIKFDAVELTPQHVIGGQGFLMAVQVSIVDGMQLALASFESTDEGWQEDSSGYFTLDIAFSAQVFPLGVFEETSVGRSIVANVDISYTTAPGATTVTLRAYEQFSGVLGVLTQ
jgi:hypothetical protein